VALPHVRCSFAIGSKDNPGGSCHAIGPAHPLRAKRTTAAGTIVCRVKNREDTSGKRPRRFAVSQFCWLGPGEVVVLDVVRTGRISAGSVLLGLAVALAALTPVPELRTGVRAGADLVARLIFLPVRGPSALLVLLDAGLVARAWFSAGRPRRDGGAR